MMANANIGVDFANYSTISFQGNSNSVNTIIDKLISNLKYLHINFLPISLFYTWHTHAGFNFSSLNI